MKVLKAILITLLLINMITCAQNKNSQNKTIKTDLDKVELKGKVKNRKAYEIKDGIEIFSFEDEFNKNGFFTKRVAHSNGKLWVDAKFSYENSKIDQIKEVVYDNYPDDKRIKYTEFVYHTNKTQIKYYENEKLNKFEIEKFDKNKNKIYSQSIAFRDTTTTLYKYDKFNNLLQKKNKDVEEIIKYNDDNLMIVREVLYKVGPSYKVNYFYDENKNRIGEKVYENSIFYSGEKINYKNNLVKEHYYYNKDEQEIRVIYYEYDHTGNVVKETTNYLEHQKNTMIIFKIEYYN